MCVQYHLLHQVGLDCVQDVEHVGAVRLTTLGVGIGEEAPERRVIFDGGIDLLYAKLIILGD